MTPSRVRSRLQRALAGPLPGPAAHRIAWPEHLPTRGPIADDDGFRPAAVLLLLFPRTDGVRIPLVERPATMPHHPGQIACPGGRLEPGERAEDAALRELNEELGVPRDAVGILGALSPIWIPVSGFRVQPFVGWADREPTWVPHPREVGRLLFADPAQIALRGPDGTYRREHDDASFEAPAYRVPGGLVWGATALLLAEFGEIWKQLGEDAP